MESPRQQRLRGLGLVIDQGRLEAPINGILSYGAEVLVRGDQHDGGLTNSLVRDGCLDVAG